MLKKEGLRQLSWERLVETKRMLVEQNGETKNNFL